MIKKAETGVKGQSDKRLLNVIAYTRKSTTDDSEFSSLEAQREAIASYVESQRALGWVLDPERYDDNGFTGANTDRPAFRRMMDRVEAGRVDIVATYKIDRLSRSLSDFLAIMKTLETHGVRFVSTTQSFDTTTHMGKFVMHQLASFGELERGMISERTKDKMRAARKRGLWTGGVPLLGLDAKDGRLVENQIESERVRTAFDEYLRTRSLVRTAAELNRRGWTTKSYTTKDGRHRPGQAFDKTRLHRLLTNVLYIGKISYEGTEYDGDHPAVVEESVFRRVQELLRTNGKRSGSAVRNRHQVMLKGLLRCAACDAAMSFSYAVRRNKRYGYYLCCAAARRGWKNSGCPSPSVPMAEIEAFVVEKIAAIGRDPALQAEVVEQAKAQLVAAVETQKAEEAEAEKDLATLRALERRTRAGTPDDVADRVEAAEARLRDVRVQLADAERDGLDEKEIVAALSGFTGIWQHLLPLERARVVALLLERIEYDGAAGTIALTFRPNGLRSFAEETNTAEEGAKS